MSVKSEIRDEKGVYTPRASMLSEDAKCLIESLFQKYEGRLSFDAISHLIISEVICISALRIALEA